MTKNKNYEILDKILADSQSGRGDVVWVADPRHPDGGYWAPASNLPASGKQFESVDDIERYLRS